MPQHFLDSSALLKRYRDETGSQWMLDLSKTPDRLIVARLAHVEVTAAIVRRGRQSAESFHEVALALAALDSDMANEFQVVEFSEPLVFRAIKLAQAHSLRAADAI
jgi:predicted nucleic acid-binding protein